MVKNRTLDTSQERGQRSLTMLSAVNKTARTARNLFLQWLSLDLAHEAFVAPQHCLAPLGDKQTSKSHETKAHQSSPKTYASSPKASDDVYAVRMRCTRLF